MKYLQALVDNSSTLLSWLLALFGMLLLLGAVNLNEDQITGIMTFAGATIGMVAVLLTVAKRTVVTRVDNAGVIRNGPASTSATGTPTTVLVNDDGSLVPQATVDPALAVAGPKGP